jgi:virulence factor Mce-like protein
MRRTLNRAVSHTPSKPVLALAALGVIALLAGLTVVALIAPRGVPGLKYYELNAQFNDIAQIADLSEVRIAGRHVGQVTTSELRNGHATVTLQMFPGQGPLRSDTTARIRLKGLLGAKFVDVVPGRRGPKLRSGSTLPVRQTSSAVELLDVLQALDTPTRRQLQVAVRGLGEGFLGRGTDLNQMFGVAPKFFENARAVSDSVLARTGAAARFAPSAESLAAAYDPVRAELAAGFRPEAQALEAFASRRPELDQLLVAAPPNLEAMRRGFDASTPLLNETAGMARAIQKINVPAPAALRATSVLLRDSVPALRASRPLLDSLGTAVNPTLTFLHGFDPIVPPAIKALVNNLPGLRELGRRGCDVLSFAHNWRSTLGFGVGTGVGDPTGTLDDGQAGLGPLNSLRVLAVRPLELETLSADAAAPVQADAYPAPCAAVSERAP